MITKILAWNYNAAIIRFQAPREPTSTARLGRLASSKGKPKLQPQ